MDFHCASRGALGSVRCRKPGRLGFGENPPGNSAQLSILLLDTLGFALLLFPLRLCFPHPSTRLRHTSHCRGSFSEQMRCPEPRDHLPAPFSFVMLTALCSLAHTPSSAPFGPDAGSAGLFPSPGAWQSASPVNSLGSGLSTHSGITWSIKVKRQINIFPTSTLVRRKSREPMGAPLSDECWNAVRRETERRRPTVSDGVFLCVVRGGVGGKT